MNTDNNLKKNQLGRRIITENGPPYVIAEIGVNHEGSLETAIELIDLAKEGGADAAKFQSYKTETLVSKHSPAYWDAEQEATKSQFELFKKYDRFVAKEYQLLAEHCQKVGIDFVSTPFDDAAIDFLYPLIPFYKIASADLTNIPFLRKIARKGKPIVLSTGASTLGEIDIAVREITESGCSQLALLHCILNYPTEEKCANLNMIFSLRKSYPDLIIGYSDHTLPDDSMLVLTAAYLKGAKIIEKHFTGDKTLPGNDHYHAMDVNDLKVFLKNVSKLSLLGGSFHKQPLPSEKLSRENARRSIVLQKNVAKGTVLIEEMLTCKRPAHGISAAHWDQVVGHVMVEDREEDYVLQWSDIHRKNDG